MRSSLQASNDAPPKYIPVWAVAAVLKRPHRTIRSWVAAGVVPSIRDEKTGALLVDGQAATLHHERTATRRRMSGVSVVDIVKSSKSSSELAPVSLQDRVLSCVSFREVVITEQNPPPEIVIPVRLDLSPAEQQLNDFMDRLRSTLGQISAAIPATPADDTPPSAA